MSLIGIDFLEVNILHFYWFNIYLIFNVKCKIFKLINSHNQWKERYVKWVLFIFGIAFFTFITNVLIRQSYNILFFFLKKPYAWFLSMLVIGFLLLFISSFFNNKLNMVTIVATLAFFANVPQKTQIVSDEKMEKFCNEFTEISNSRMKYRIGLGLYVFGCVIGWILGYSTIVQL